MRPTPHAYIALLLLLLFPLSTMAAGDKKKKKHVEARTELPMPDLRIPALKPLKPMAPVQEPMRPKANVITYVEGPHTPSTRGGIDVSHYQGQINWERVAKSGDALYAFIKATESNTLVDNTFQYNVREARRAGIPVGSYHFFRPHVSGEAQLQHFLNNVDMSQQDLIPILDIEVRGKASLQDFHREIRAWLVGFEKRFHYKPAIYASVNFYNKYLAGAFDDYIYMIAKYSEECPNPQGPIPFAMWQYSASGRIDGIKGAVDKSCFIDHFDLKDILIKNHR